MKTALLVFFGVWLLFLACEAACDNCPGWPCRTNADCDTGSGCACSGTATGPGTCR